MEKTAKNGDAAAPLLSLMMTAPAPLNLHFDTDPAWIERVRVWAESEPEVVAVWVFGSRATGHRSAKPDALATPDLDIAYRLRDPEPGGRLGLAIFRENAWRAFLQAGIDVPIDLQLAEDDDAVVGPAVRAHGVLVYTGRQG